MELSKAMWAADVGAVGRQVAVRALHTNVEQGEQRAQEGSWRYWGLSTKVEEESSLKRRITERVSWMPKRKIFKEKHSAVSNATEGSSKTPRGPSGFGTLWVQSHPCTCFLGMCPFHLCCWIYWHKINFIFFISLIFLISVKSITMCPLSVLTLLICTFSLFLITLSRGS